MTVLTRNQIGWRETISIFLRNVFSDFGVLTGYDKKNSSIKLNDDGSLRASAGFGLTWISPFGPLAIDLAYPVLRKSQDKIQYFSFSFGTNF